MLRVLMLNYEYPPLGGGSGNATRYLLQELSRAGSLEVDLVTSGLGSTLREESLSSSVRIFRLPVGKRHPHFWRAAELARWTVGAHRLLRRLARTRRYDLCHCWGGWPAGVLGSLSRTRVPYVVALRGSDVPGYSPRLRWLDPLLFRPLSARVWMRARAVTSVSERLRALAQRTAPRLSLRVIPNGVDASLFHPGSPPAERTILFVGRLIERKGVVHLLHAFRDIVEKELECSLCIVGDGPERKSLEQLSRDAGLAGRVRFLGAVEHAELPQLYRRATLFVMPALEEAMPNAMLEAMASGLPCITTDTGGAELVAESGTVVPAGASGPIRDAILRYLADPGLRRRHGRRAREAAERLGWSRTAQAYLELYAEVTSR